MPSTPPPEFAFTCVMPLHAGADPGEYAAAIASLGQSTVTPAAILVCHEGALPATLEAALNDSVERFGVTLLVNPGPRGIQHSLNHAARQARTPWIARFDGDDLNLPDRFEKQIAHLAAHPEVDALGGDILEFFPDGRDRRKSMPRSHEDIVRFARWRNPLNHMTAMFRTSVFNACGGYPDWPRMEDYGLWLRMIAAGARLANMDQPLVRARLGENFYRRRSGMANLGHEWRLYQLKRAVPGIGAAPAAAALAARTAALVMSGPAGLVYELGLRR